MGVVDLWPAGMSPVGGGGAMALGGHVHGGHASPTIPAPPGCGRTGDTQRGRGVMTARAVVRQCGGRIRGDRGADETAWRTGEV